jgi:serine/threonine protein kinase
VRFAPPGTRLIERLGMGSVFEVGLVHDQKGRVLVVKRLAPPARAPECEWALTRERDVLRAARGAPLPELIASGTDEEGLFLLEARAPGSPVRALFDLPERVDSARWLLLARAASSALAKLHGWQDAGGPLCIAHGDISPDNLFFSEGGVVTLVDLSSATWREARSPALAGDMGTVPYAAPELLRGEASSSQTADVYALAATLLAAAVGPITRASNAAGRLLEAATEGVRRDRIEERTDLPPGARVALAAALRFDPAGRLSSAPELAERLSKG